MTPERNSSARDSEETAKPTPIELVIPKTSRGSGQSDEEAIQIEGVGTLRREFVKRILLGLAGAPGPWAPTDTAASRSAAPFSFGSEDLLWSALERGMAHRRGVEGYSRKTISSMRTATNSFRSFLCATGRTEAFLRGDPRQQREILEEWTGSLRSRGGSHDTVSNYWRSLKAAFAAVAEAEGTFSPFTGLRAPRPGQRRIRAVTPDALFRAYDFLLNRQCRSELERLRDLSVFALAAMGGLRNGEIRRVAVSEIDTESGSIQITKSKGRFGGKDRVAQVVGDALPIIRAYSEARWKAKRTHREFITSVSRDRPVSEKALLAIFRRIEVSGIVVRPHMCRHTYNVILERAGVRDAARMELLGHTKLAALQYYTHAFAGEAAAAARSIHLGLDTRSLRRSSTKERNPGSASRQVLAPDTRVPHGRYDAGVAREGLNDMDRSAALQEHRDEGMS
jgi:integrase